jgi:hypothetical protein
MSIIEAKSNAAVRGDLDAVVREYAFPDVHIGAGEDESPYMPFSAFGLRRDPQHVCEHSLGQKGWVTRAPSPPGADFCLYPGRQLALSGI